MKKYEGTCNGCNHKIVVDKNRCEDCYEYAVCDRHQCKYCQECEEYKDNHK